MAVKSWTLLYASITASSWAFSTVSSLLMTSTAGTFIPLIRSMSSRSGPPTLGMGSTSSSTASTSATLFLTTSTM